jgi:molecular chaperone GrpE
MENNTIQKDQAAGTASEAVKEEPLAQDPQSQRIAELEAEAARLKDQCLRALAELDNLRKRTEREREETIKYASSHFAKDMLPVADNLRRALENCPDTVGLPESVKALISGVEMVEKELLVVFEKHGIKKLAPHGEKFDHKYHEAMFEQEHPDHPPGTVIQLLQAGYVMHDRLLRPALVGVSKASAGENTQPPEDTKKDAENENQSS